MGLNKSSGVAKAGLATGIVGASGLLLNSGFLGGLFNGGGGMRQQHDVDMVHQVEKVSALQSQVSMLEAERYTDNLIRKNTEYTNQSVLDLYKYTQSELKERDPLIVQNAINTARAEEREKCLQNEISRLGISVEKLSDNAYVQQREIDGIKCDARVNSERLVSLTNETASAIQATREHANSMVRENTLRFENALSALRGETSVAISDTNCRITNLATTLADNYLPATKSISGDNITCSADICTSTTA